MNTLRQFIQRLDALNLWRHWKSVGPKKLLYLPRLLNAREKKIILALLFTALISGTVFFSRMYLRVTVPIPKIGSSYTEGIIGNPHTVNPLFASRDTDRSLSRLVFSSLLTYGANGSIQNDLAESYAMSPDGKTYTVALKKNAVWHDGNPLTADDVLFTIKLTQNPLYKSPLRANWQGVQIETIDQYTIRFSLRTPYAPFIENLTIGIVPKHLWKNITPEQIPLHELSIKPIGSGPYQFSDLEQNADGSISSYTLTRNKAYYREGPYLKKLSFVFFQNEDEIMAAWRKGTIDGFGPTPAKRIPDLETKNASLYSIRMPRLFGIFFNDQKAPSLQEKAVREAIARAIDKSRLAELNTSGGAVPIDSPLPSNSENGQSAQPRFAYDPEAARQLLESAGWKDVNGDSIREKTVKKQKGKETKLELRFVLTTSDWADLLRSAELIKEMLKEVGIEITIEKQSFANLESSVIRPRNFQILLFGQVYGFEADPFAFWHSSQIKDPGLNIALYSSAKADRLLEVARTTSDSEARRKTYEEFSALLSNDIPAVFLFSQLYLYLLPADLKGIHFEQISLPADRFNEITQWYRATKRIFQWK